MKYFAEAAKTCCASPMKFYTEISCRLCWQCQNCRTMSCDKVMYQMNKPLPLRQRFLETDFLKAYEDYSIKGYDTTVVIEPPEIPQGPNCSAVIMKVNEQITIRVKDPANIYVYCDKIEVNTVMWRNNVDTDVWMCKVGPQKRPLVATLTIDNKKIPMIVTE